jgi:hypothetical protein
MRSTGSTFVKAIVAVIVIVGAVFFMVTAGAVLYGALVFALWFTWVDLLGLPTFGIAFLEEVSWLASLGIGLILAIVSLIFK